MHHWAALAHIVLLSACRLVELCKMGARCLLKGVQGRHTYDRCGGLAAWRGSSFSMSSAQTGDRQDPVWWAQGLVGCCWEQEPLGSCPVCIPCHPAGTLFVSHLATWLFVRVALPCRGQHGAHVRCHAVLCIHSQCCFQPQGNISSADAAAAGAVTLQAMRS